MSAAQPMQNVTTVTMTGTLPEPSRRARSRKQTMRAASTKMKPPWTTPSMS